jgi:molybdopterin converting factor small subunit
MGNQVLTMSDTATGAALLVHLPLALRDHTGGREAVEVVGSTVEEALADLVTRFPPLRRHLYDDGLQLRGYVNVYLNEDEVRTLAHGMNAAVAHGDTLMIIPSIAGG